MPGIGERLWEMGKTPSEHMGLVFFGLVTLLAGVLAISLIGVAGGGSAAALILAANALLGIGGFFLTLALFLGAYASSGESVPVVVWRVAQLLVAALVLIFVFV